MLHSLDMKASILTSKALFPGGFVVAFLGCNLLKMPSSEHCSISMHHPRSNHAYGVTVAEFTSQISQMRNELGGNGNKDEGLIAPSSASSAVGKHHHLGNLLAENSNAFCYQRAPKEILRIMYGKGTAGVPGGFFPNGANGQIAKSYLHNSAF